MDDPIAYFLTWTTYGSWLPGDERGWTERPGQFREPNRWKERGAEKAMTEAEILLSKIERHIVHDTIEAHCEVRGWKLFAQNCRTQHVHVVVSAPAYDPDTVMSQFKSWCTRRLTEHRNEAGEENRKNWWTQRGSKRLLYDEEALDSAVSYVLDEQDGSRFER